MESKHIHTSIDGDNIMTVLFDNPDKPVNTLSPMVLEELSDAIESIEKADKDKRPAGVIFASDKDRCFIAGADLFEIKEMDDEQVYTFLEKGQQIYSRIAKLPMTTVAAINGDCLGGGLELALSCDRRVAADSGKVSIGLPEVKLGILPAWGGTTRLPRVIGLTKALPLLLTGRTLKPRKAKKLGVVNETVRPEALRSAAKRIAKKPRRPMKHSMLDRAAARFTFVRDKILAKATEQTEAHSYGNYPAPAEIIDTVRTSFDKGEEASFESERKALVKLTGGAACQNLMRLFFLRQQIKKDVSAMFDAKPATIKHAAVIGGGVMGSGIVHALITRGIKVRLVEINADAISAALNRIEKMLTADARAGRLNRIEAKHAFNRVSATTEWTGLKLADIVIEAAAEKMEIKNDIFSKLDELTRPDCVLASNTSSLSITEMAKATKHPNRVVGVHFFNPVPKMPLVEIVKQPQSDDQSMATAIALTHKLGKVAIAVNDAPGFVVNRVLIPYLAEALQMAAQGQSIATIDEVMKRWGMPMGPFELLDQIGLDIGVHVLRSLEGHLGDRVAMPDGMQRAIDNGWLGMKTGRGFYVYPSKKNKKAKPTVNHEMVSLLNATSTTESGTIDDEVANAIIDRLMMIMVNEAVRVMSERVIDSTDAFDLATVFGLGLAPFRGGLISYADTFGATELIKKMTALDTKCGARFTPAPLLKAMVEANVSKLSELEPNQIGDLVAKSVKDEVKETKD